MCEDGAQLGDNIGSGQTRWIAQFRPAMRTWVKLLRKLGASTRRNLGGDSPQATKSGDYELAAILLAAGAPLVGPADHSDTPLHNACLSGVEMARTSQRFSSLFLPKSRSSS